MVTRLYWAPPSLNTQKKHLQRRHVPSVRTKLATSPCQLRRLAPLPHNDVKWRSNIGKLFFGIPPHQGSALFALGFQQRQNSGAHKHTIYKITKFTQFTKKKQGLLMEFIHIIK